MIWKIINKKKREIVSRGKNVRNLKLVVHPLVLTRFSADFTGFMNK